MVDMKTFFVISFSIRKLFTFQLATIQFENKYDSISGLQAFWGKKKVSKRKKAFDLIWLEAWEK